MVCQACNAPIGSDVRFCPKCGSPAANQPYPPPQVSASGYPPAYATPYQQRLRVTRNLQALGVLWCVFGAYRIIAGLIGMFFLRVVTSQAFGGAGPLAATCHLTSLKLGWASFCLS